MDPKQLEKEIRKLSNPTEIDPQIVKTIADLLIANHVTDLAAAVAPQIALGDLSDVSLSGESNNEVLKYKTSGSNWVNDLDAT